MPNEFHNNHGLRILMISQHYPPQVNGYAIQCEETARHLRKRGHQVLVLTASDASGDRKTRSDVLKLLRVSPWGGCRDLSLKCLFSQVKRRNIFRSNKLIARAAAQDFDPDIVMVWQFEGIGLGVVQGLQRLGIPMIYNIGDRALCGRITLMQKDPNPVWRVARRWTHGVNPYDLDTSNLILVSEDLKASYISAGFRNTQMTVIYNGIDSKYIIQQPGKLGSGGRLLYAGRIHPTKGVDVAIKTLALLDSEGKGRFTLDIVGKGAPEYVGKLEDLGRSLNLEESLRFVGAKSRETLLALYQEYDLLIFPSVNLEPFGLTVIEAMARGVPVIASRRGGPKEIITHMEDGLLVEPENPRAFAEGVKLLVNRAGLRKRMAERAITKVRAKFTLEKQVARTEELLFRVMHQKWRTGSKT